MPITRNLRAHGWIPDQHGAWPMALIPLFLGIYASEAQSIHLLLSAAWLTAFALFHVTELWAKSAPRRKKRITPALIFWLIATGTLGTPLLFLAPTLLLWAPLFLPLVFTAAWGIFKKNSRSLLVRTTTIIASCLMSPVAYTLGGTWQRTEDLTHSSTHLAAQWFSELAGTKQGTYSWLIACICAGYFLGTVPYVRSLIRGRGNIRWIITTGLWHILVLCTWLFLWMRHYAHWSLVILGCALLARGCVIPLKTQGGKPLRPAVIGISEIVFSALLIAALMLSHSLT
ncbi:YwiC-like family protein [Schaalia sp. lx-100]|uniref:YwiC-like family protein n=1 Tax=Schaalia sp. lx-100 TaxID=2899081 RepID=UPI001E32E668|nr:YwiC-like family protein [Schaalia sp. lx-100]MCD4557790.1 YwiC-like family protein [Schaalia sp. lx-100]